ncbi:hypothetical protein Tco_1162281 [Tanacetum coccineum]
MINLPAGDTSIGIYSRIFDSSGVRIPFSSFFLAVLKYFKVYISQLVPLEGVLVQSGLSRVWRNPMCDPMLRHSDNTVMSIHDFLCMPSLEKATVREEPHELGTSILGRVADRTTPPAPAGTAIPRASLEEIVITRPDLSGASSSGLAADDGVEHTDDGTLDDDGQRNGSEFAMEKEVEAHAELSRGMRRTTRASFHVSHGVGEDVSSPAQEAMVAPGTQTLDTNAVSPYTKDDWDEIHGVNLGLRKKELYKDPKTQINKKQSADLKQHKESTVRASEQLGQINIVKNGAEDILAKEKTKIKEELKSQLEHRERQVEEIQGKHYLLLSVRFHSTCLRTSLIELLFAFPDTTFPYLAKVSSTISEHFKDIAIDLSDRVTLFFPASLTTASIRTNTHRDTLLHHPDFGQLALPSHEEKEEVR